MEVVLSANTEQQIALLKAHPDLAGKLAVQKQLSSFSAEEQGTVGLDRLTSDEFEKFSELNESYKTKFSFPFIIAVRENTKDSILQAFSRRLELDSATEMITALKEVGKIAKIRLRSIITK